LRDSLTPPSLPAAAVEEASDLSSPLASAATAAGCSDAPAPPSAGRREGGERESPESLFGPIVAGPTFFVVFLCSAVRPFPLSPVFVAWPPRFLKLAGEEESFMTSVPPEAVFAPFLGLATFAASAVASGRTAAALAVFAEGPGEEGQAAAAAAALALFGAFLFCGARRFCPPVGLAADSAAAAHSFLSASPDCVGGSVWNLMGVDGNFGSVCITTTDADAGNGSVGAPTEARSGGSVCVLTVVPFVAFVPLHDFLG